jgi:glutamine synthetase
VAAVAKRLAAAGVDAVALAVVGPDGVTRVKTVPLRRFEEVAKVGVGLSNAFSVFLVNDSMTSAPGIEGPAGDTRLIPDPASAVALAASPGWAMAAVDQRTQDGEPWPPCGRSFARRMLERLRGAGLELRGAYELEFFLGWRTRPGEPDEPDPTPAHTGPGYSAPVLVDQEAFAGDLIRALETQGTGVMQFHPEYSTGQFELSVPHTAGVAPADTNLVARHTIRAVARANGMAVSFSPVVFAGLVGNGDHLHLSLWDRRGRNVFHGGDGPEGMTREAESFAAGVLASLPAIVGVSCPSIVSYLRLQPHRWSGPWACWGRENREAGLRFVTGMTGDRPAEANLEVKPVDGSANPYLALGAIVAAGLDGLERDLRLPEPVTVDPGSLSVAERRKRKVTQLPSSLRAAIGELERSTVLREAMGDMLFDSFVATRKGELAAFEDVDDDAVVRAHRWRY